MATKRNTKEKVEAKHAEAPEGVRPKDLAATLGVNPKSLRAFLRRQFPRTSEIHGSSWYLGNDQVKAATDHFAAKTDDESSSDES